jgi:outer membrane protein
MDKRLPFLSLLAFTLLLSFFVIWQHIHTPKIVCIRTAVLVDGYLGTKEAKQLHSQKVQQWQANIDTLSGNLNENIANYHFQQTRLNAMQLQQMVADLQQEKNNLEKYKYTIEEKAQEEEEKLMQGTLKQINTFIEAYALRKGYTVVMGTTTSGNILFADKSIDITDEILTALNAEYNKKTP